MPVQYIVAFLQKNKCNRTSNCSVPIVLTQALLSVRLSRTRVTAAIVRVLHRTEQADHGRLRFVRTSRSKSRRRKLVLLC